MGWGVGGHHSFPKIQALINLRGYKVAPSLGGPTLEAHIHTYLHHYVVNELSLSLSLSICTCSVALNEH
jgi:hypothetical protein